MKVQSLMTRNVRVAREDGSLADAAKLMWETDCGFVPVVDAATGRLCGVITDRDICMGAMTQGRPIQEIPLATSMTRSPLHACGPETDLKAAQELMRHHQIRRLPVVDAEQRVVGVLSLNDLATRAVLSRGNPPPHATPADIGATLARIGEPHDARETGRSAQAGA